MIETDAEICNKVVWKQNPEEKVGVLVNVKNKTEIIEYNEMEEDLLFEKDQDTNKLKYGAGNICNHLFNITFINDQILKEPAEKYHFAKKKIPHIQYPSMDLIDPLQPNGIKLEMFIF